MEGRREGRASTGKSTAIETASRTSQSSVKAGELRDGKLLGAGVWAEIQRGQGFAGTIGFGKRAQVIH